MRRWLAGALTLLLLPSVTAWNQTAGDEGRSAGAPVMHDVLDVGPAWALAGEANQTVLSFGPGAIMTPHGLAFAAGQVLGGCTVTFTGMDGQRLRTVPLPDCAGFHHTAIQAYHAPSDRLVLCNQLTDGDDWVAGIMDATTGELAARIVPRRDFNAVAAQAPADAIWECHGTAMADGIAYMAFMAYPTENALFATAGSDHALVAWDLARGQVLWATRLTSLDYAGFAGPVFFTSDPEVAPLPRVWPRSLTVTDVGLLMTADIDGARAVVSFDLDGVTTGIQVADTFAGQPTRNLIIDNTVNGLHRQAFAPVDGHGWSTAMGPLAIVGLGQDLLLVDPRTDSPILRTPVTTAQPFVPHGMLGPVPYGEVIILPVQNGVVAVDSDSFEVRWSYIGDPRPAPTVWDVVADQLGRILVLESNIVEGPVVTALDPTTGALLFRVPLPTNLAVGAGATTLRMVPLDGRLAVVDLIGNAYPLGIGDQADAPRLWVSDSRPTPGRPVALRYFGAGDGMKPAAATVYWGDGSITAFDGPDQAQHTFTTSGPVLVRVVSRVDGGTTATTVLALDIGGTPPPELNFLQRAFSDQNRDTTWGLIGLILAVFSGIGAYAANVWRRRGIGKDLRQLEGLRLQSADDPIGAMHGLRTFQRSLRERAAAGKLESSEFIPLSHEAQALSHAVRQRVLSRFDGRIGKHLRNVVEAALADGVLTPAERTGILAGLDGEMGLAVAERSAFRRLLSEWS